MKRKLSRFIGISIIFAGAFISCQNSKVPEKAELAIITINDVHGEFENLARFAAYVNYIRERYEHVLVVSAGDNFTGNPINDKYYRTNYPIIDFLNRIGVNVATVGNHEFDYGLQVLQERIAESNFEYVCANVDVGETSLVPLKPYKILDVGGIKVAFLGLTEVDEKTKIPETLSTNVEGLTFFDPIETALNYTNLREKCHVFIGLTHIGYEEDEVLAAKMPELDLIIGGHSHTFLEIPTIINDVVITQTGRLLSSLGQTIISLENGKITNIENKLIDLRKDYFVLETEDRNIQTMVNRYNENSVLKKTITRLKYDLVGLNEVGAFMSDAIVTIPGIDFAFTNCGGIRSSGFEAGNIQAFDVYKLSPFGNFIVTARMKSQEIEDLIKAAYRDRGNCLMPPGGLNYVVTLNPDNNKQIDDVALYLPDGTPLNPDKYYTVGMNNYISTRYLESHPRLETTKVLVVDNLIDYLSNSSKLDYRDVSSRIRIK